MATVTGITAAKADEILGMSVVSGAINGSGHLILTRANGSTIDAGDFTAIVSGILGDQVTAKVNDILPDAVAGTVINKGSVSGALTLPELNSDNIVNAMVKVTAGGNITFNATALPASPKPNTQWVMELVQDPTGNRTLTLTGFKRAMGSLPISTNGFAKDLICFVYDGTDWLVGLMGVDFK